MQAASPTVPGPAEAAPDAVSAAMEAYRAASTNLDAQVGLCWVLNCPAIGGEQGSNLARKYCRVRRLLVTVRHTTREGRFACCALPSRREQINPFLGDEQ